MSIAEFRRACARYAEKFVALQRADFRRLGVLGTWDQPYLTMTPDYQASIVRALGRFVEQGAVYKGKKPVHWCLRCRTALAEAEVEYENHTSPSVYVEFPLHPESPQELVRRVPVLANRAVSVLIWTTTPWTIPSNLAKPIIAQLKKFGKPKRGWLGVNIQTVTKEIAEGLGLKEATGALVANITENSPAANGSPSRLMCSATIATLSNSASDSNFSFSFCRTSA